MLNSILKIALGLCLALVATTSAAQAQGFYLCPKCGQYHVKPQYAQSVVSTRQVNRSQAAYNHALKEAKILAKRGFSYHPLGIAPGAKISGTGSSFSPNTPNHCYDYLPENRLVARAVVQGKDGKYWWSAHYR